MFAYVNHREHADAVTLQEVDEPTPGPNEAIVAVETFSLNRGELALIAHRPSGWRPGQDVGGTVIHPSCQMIAASHEVTGRPERV